MSDGLPEFIMRLGPSHALRSMADARKVIA